MPLCVSASRPASVSDCCIPPAIQNLRLHFNLTGQLGRPPRAGTPRRFRIALSGRLAGPVRTALGAGYGVARPGGETVFQVSAGRGGGAREGRGRTGRAGEGRGGRLPRSWRARIPAQAGTVPALRLQLLLKARYQAMANKSEKDVYHRDKSNDGYQDTGGRARGGGRAGGERAVHERRRRGEGPSRSENERARERESESERARERVAREREGERERREGRGSERLFEIRHHARPTPPRSRRGGGGPA